MAEQMPFSTVEFATNPEPRCPCVLLLDVSASMNEVISNAGQDTGQTVQQDGKTYRLLSGGTTRMDSLNEGIKAYRDDLINDSLAAQRVEVSIITFGNDATTVVPFVVAQEFMPPTLTASGMTAMGAGIVKAIEAVNERKQSYKNNGVHYYRPWIFLITDGEPNDSWEEAARLVKEGENKKQFAFFAVGVEGANFDTLNKIAVRKPLQLKGYSFREMFVWLSQSQRSVSQSNPGEEDQVKLAAPTGWANL